MSQPFNKKNFDLKWRGNHTGCWEWLRSKNPDGYGRVKRNGKLESAHRVAYELYVGPIGDKQVLHKCDNPGCVNPEHLFLGTVKENNEDKAHKGRAKGHTMRGEAHPNHKLTSDNVYAIKCSPGMSAKFLAEHFGVSVGLINDIRAGRKWKHISDGLDNCS